MDFDTIVDGIKELPPLSDTAKVVERLYVNGAENVNITNLVYAIESDASLTVNILKIINAPYYGFSRKIASVSQAVTLFGTQTIYGLVIKFCAESLIIANLRPYGISSTQFNQISHLQSSLMNQWYSKIDLHHAQVMTPLALIMESGKLVTSREIVKAGKIKEFQDGLLKADDLIEYENNFFGTTSSYVTGVLFEHWNLDPLYVSILKELDYIGEDTSPQMEAYIFSLDVVRTAINAKEILTQNSIAHACDLIEDKGFGVDHFLQVTSRIKEKLNKNEE
ncbi:HDOD domain-containing protein [Sulfurimonas sp.]|uniref:HDOD domain-containing protein n=1 Tax=Sulfurimonas sp. TaxID=2022749 RepID=UPI003D0AA3A0